MCKLPKLYKYTDIVARMLDPKFLCTPGGGERSIEFSSYDRASRYDNGEYKGWYANGDGTGCIEFLEDGGTVMAQVDGPGYISHMWAATSKEGAVKIYIDGEDSPAFDLPFCDYFNGNAFPFSRMCYGAARGFNCYVPITFAKSLKIVAYGDWGKYYQFHVTTLPADAQVESVRFPLTADQCSALQKVNDHLSSKLGTNPLGCEDAPFERFTVSRAQPAIHSIHSAGAISGLLVKIPALDTLENNSCEAVTMLKNLLIRIRWDGEDIPSVNVPLGDFFGTCYGIGGVKTLLYGVREDKTFYSYFYMPFRSGAQIEILSLLPEETNIELSVNVLPIDPKLTETLYFNAFFTKGKYSDVFGRFPDHVFLKTEGKGRFVGLNLHVSKITDQRLSTGMPGFYWWGEGDEKFFVDEEKFPSWFGTGTEDFFGYAWCSATLFSEAYHAQAYCYGGSQGRGNRSLTRLLMLESIPFEEEFEGCLEKYYPAEIVKYGYTPYFYAARTANVLRPDYSTALAYTEYFNFDPANESL